MISRRAFTSALTGLSATALFDPDILSWKQGAKVYSFSSPIDFSKGAVIWWPNKIRVSMQDQIEMVENDLSNNPKIASMLMDHGHGQRVTRPPFKGRVLSGICSTIPGAMNPVDRDSFQLIKFDHGRLVRV